MNERVKAVIHPLSFRLHPLIWPDPGLTRNTRRRCYRCSVPGLAGFTRQALCGARDLIKNIKEHFRFLIADCRWTRLLGVRVIQYFD
jgi:hypothetical protein